MKFYVGVRWQYFLYWLDAIVSDNKAMPFVVYELKHTIENDIKQ